MSGWSEDIVGGPEDFRGSDEGSHYMAQTSAARLRVERTDLALDFSHDAMDAAPELELVEDVDPWVARRRWAFGASDMGALFVALGMRSPEDFPDFVQANAKRIKIRLPGDKKARAVPRLFLEKAGLRRGLKPTKPMLLGTKREPELLRQWTEKVRHGGGGAEAQLVVPNTVRHSSVVPRSFYPLRHFRLPLAVTPDAWAEDLLGDLVAIEAKCSFKPYRERYSAASPHHVLQAHAQMLVMIAGSALIVEGEGWSNDFFDHMGEPTGPAATWPVRRDERVVSEIERAVTLGWEAVEELRDAAKEEA